MPISFISTIILTICKAGKRAGNLIKSKYFKNSPKSLMLFALISCLIAVNASVIFNTKSVEAASNFMFDKVITWADGSTEHVQIDNNGFFYLDGLKKKLVGINLTCYVPGVQHPYDFWHPENLQYYDHELDYLESIGVRIVRMEMEYRFHKIEDYEQEAAAYRAYLDMFYEHKMLLLNGTFARYTAGFNNLEAIDFVMHTWDGNVDTFSHWISRCCDIINEYPNNVAICAENEMDCLLKVSDGYWFLTEDQTYTAEDARAYMEFLTSCLRQKLDIPITNTLMLNPIQPEIKQVCVDSVDLISFNCYEQTYDNFIAKANYVTSMLNITNNWWCLELNHRDANGSIYSSMFTSEHIEGIFDSGATIAMLYTTNSAVTDHCFFDTNGNPIQSFVAIAADLDRLQAPISEIPYEDIPVVHTVDASDITSSSVILNGILDNAETIDNVNVSFQWGTVSGEYANETPAFEIAEGEEFSYNLTGLNQGTTYYFRAKAATESEYYGIEKSFTIGSLPGVIAGDVTNIAETSATLNGVLDDLGSATEVNVSFIWGTGPRVGLDNETDVIVMNNTGEFSIDVNGLISGTTYYYEAKAVGDGTAYSETGSFMTKAVQPIVTTGDVSDITETSVVISGYLNDLGYSSTVLVSIEWGTDAENFTNETESLEMTDEGQFSFNLNGLNPGTWYSYRARAVGEGTSYGSELDFTTLAVEEPSVTTIDASGITVESAMLNGSLNGMGTAENVLVSFEWGLSSGNYTNETTPQTMEAEDAFHYDLTGLTSETTYYYRAKVVCDGTYYGDEISFTTSSAPVIQTKAPKLLPVKTSVILRWNPVDGATNYILQVSVSPDCSGEYLFNEDVGKATKQKVKGLTIGTTYYWRLKAGNNNGISDWSPVWSFIVE